MNIVATAIARRAINAAITHDIDLLRHLATDAAAEVRVGVARNASTETDVLDRLMDDGDLDVAAVATSARNARRLRYLLPA